MLRHRHPSTEAAAVAGILAATTGAEVRDATERSTYGCSSTRSRTPWRNFSHTRGTPKNNVGRQAWRSSATVAKLLAAQVSAPAAI